MKRNYKYMVRFADKRKKDLVIEAKNKEQAVDKVYKKHGAGFFVRKK